MASDEFSSFKPSLFEFLEELAANNNREWFQANKQRYQADVVEPAFAFIRAMRPRLHQLSPTLQAVDRKVGGSLFRIYRDIRFSKDKTPYKTHVGIRFPHSAGKHQAAPGCYVSLSPAEVYAGIGIWRPPAADLNRIRTCIDTRRQDWSRVRNEAAFQRYFQWGGERLKRPPRGYSADHPLIEDLKRKDFAAFRQLSVDAALRKDFPDQVGRTFLAAQPMLSFLAEAVKVEF